MREMTRENLKGAFAGESQAHMRYLIFAEQAEKDGKPNVARLFRAIAYAEQVHATNHFKTLGEEGSTAENLQKAVAGETFEVEEMYPAYMAVAELQKENGARRSMNYAIEAEKIHSDLYTQARQKVLDGMDVGSDAIYICSICGHTVVGDVPDRCPICGAPKDKYKGF